MASQELLVCARGSRPEPPFPGPNSCAWVSAPAHEKNAENWQIAANPRICKGVSEGSQGPNRQGSPAVGNADSLVPGPAFKPDPGLVVFLFLCLPAPVSSGCLPYQIQFYSTFYPCGMTPYPDWAQEVALFYFLSLSVSPISVFM